MTLDSRHSMLPDAITARAIWTAWFVLIICLSMTVWVSDIIKTKVEDDAREQFNFRAHETVRYLDNSLDDYRLLLRASAGVFAGVPTVTREHWRAYVRSLKIRENYPGILSLNFIQRIRPAETSAHIRQMRAEGISGYTIWPSGERAEYMPVTYIEPSTDRNRQVYGFDPFSDPARHASMEKARDTGMAVASHKVALKLAAHRDESTGFSMYFPVYRNGAPTDTVEQRRAALTGYIASPINIQSLLRNTLETDRFGLDIEIFDGAGTSKESLLYDSDDGRDHTVKNFRPVFSKTINFDIGDHLWTLSITSLPAFEATIDYGKQRFLLAAGTFISLLFFIVVWSLASRRDSEMAANEELKMEIAERQRAEVRMRQLSSALEQTADSVVITDRHGIIQYVNQAFEQATGFSSAEAIGKNPNIVKSGLHDAAFYQQLWDTIQRGEVFREIFTNRRKDGILYYEEKTITPLKDPEGRITHFVSTGKNITGRMEADRENMRMQVFLNSVVENLPNMLFVKEAKDLKFVRLNQAAENLLGYSRKELIGKNDYDFFPKNEADFFTAKDREVLSSGEMHDIPEELVHTKHKGVRILHTKKIPILDEKGQPLYLLGISEDITEHKKSEDMLARLGKILDDSSNEIYVFDAATLHFVQVNQGAQRNLGYTMEEFKTLTPLDFKPEFTKESFEAFVAPLRRGETQVLIFETVHRCKDGKLYPVEVRLQLSQTESTPVFVAIIQDITERQQSEERLHHLAHHDLLTNLPNRLLLQDRMALAMREAHQRERLVAVLFLDLDRFKNINDTLGHDTGDSLLKAVAERLTICLRPGDTVSRLGGDEFTILLANVAHVDDVTRVAQKILDQFIPPFRIGGRDLFISPSIGITLYPLDDKSIENLLKDADVAMYHAKDLGGNTFRFYTPELNIRAARRLELETGLRQALERQEFILHYQPLVDVKTGQIMGMEALLRWQHPEHGLIPPLDFIPLAEETGLIIPIGEWVLKTACAQTRIWHDKGFPALQVAVNLSSKQLRDKNLIVAVQQALDAAGLGARHLDLELTESVLMHDMDLAVRILKELKQTGVTFSLDDFGTGYSSLSYLKHFPIDYLKIDRSFVRDIATDLFGAGLVQAIIAMASVLNIKVIAEGVEKHEQLEFLRRHGCDITQGYYCSKPLTVEMFTELLQDWDRLRVGKYSIKNG
ncbi:MAG: EAL domain-containing protein [Hydrogenophilales bacterium]|nr:EAL domain-containing protein [Hydrogenophilales bacterium]